MRIVSLLPAGTEIVHPGDGALMVYVPAGWFVMGMDAPEADRLAKRLGYKDYHAIAAEEWFPRRRVWLPPTELRNPHAQTSPPLPGHRVHSQICVATPPARSRRSRHLHIHNR